MDGDADQWQAYGVVVCQPLVSSSMLEFVLEGLCNSRVAAIMVCIFKKSFTLQCMCACIWIMNLLYLYN